MKKKKKKDTKKEKKEKTPTTANDRHLKSATTRLHLSQASRKHNK